MLKSWMVSAAAAFAVLLLVGSVDTADAGKRGGGPNFSGGGWTPKPNFSGGQWRPKPNFSGGQWKPKPNFSGGQWKPKPNFYSGGWKPGYKHKYGRYHKYRYVGIPLAYYGYSNYDYYDNSCYWLRRRALDSGSSYWWNRYYACVDGYGPY
jgi:hypothetical protein